MTTKIELKELVMTPSKKHRTVIKNNAHWRDLIIGEVKQYNDWVTKRNDRLSEDNNETTTFYEPPIRKCYDW
ncbi:MAG TPA: hypothetical protein DEG69_20525 [Flavobacteriaceae bacterium]|mgnify:FL=1|nr:hypothetical protein [Flavobacteriaceae bacterium]